MRLVLWGGLGDFGLTKRGRIFRVMAFALPGDYPAVLKAGFLGKTRG